MATLTITINSGAGTTSVVSTFSGPDAQRILADFAIYVAKGQTPIPPQTQQTLTDYLGRLLRNHLAQIVNVAETVQPTPPSFT